MAHKLEWRTQTQIVTTAEKLQDLANRIGKLGTEMVRIKMEKIPLPWNQKHWDAVDLVIKLVKKVEEEAENQLIAHAQGRPSEQIIQMRRTEQDRKRRAAKSETDTPAKPRGRPRKSPHQAK